MAVVQERLYRASDEGGSMLMLQGCSTVHVLATMYNTWCRVDSVGTACRSSIEGRPLPNLSRHLQGSFVPHSKRFHASCVLERRSIRFMSSSHQQWYSRSLRDYSVQRPSRPGDRH